MVRTFLIAASVMGIATSAFAMEPMMMEDGQAMVIKPNGESMMFEVDMAKMEMASENATPVEDGTIFFMVDGQLMMTTDSEVEGGEMMSDSMMMMDGAMEAGGAMETGGAATTQGTTN